MIRYLAPLPAIARTDRFLRDVDAVCRQHFPLTAAVNYVDPNQVAIYLAVAPSQGQLDAWRAAVLAITASSTPTAVENEATILSQAVDTALPRLTQIINAAAPILARTQPTFGNVSGAQTAMRTLDADFDSLVAAVRDMALYQRQIIRLLTQKLDGTT